MIEGGRKDNFFLDRGLKKRQFWIECGRKDNSGQRTEERTIFLARGRKKGKFFLDRGLKKGNVWIESRKERSTLDRVRN